MILVSVFTLMALTQAIPFTGIDVFYTKAQQGTTLVYTNGSLVLDASIVLAYTDPELDLSFLVSPTSSQSLTYAATVASTVKWNAAIPSQEAFGSFAPGVKHDIAVLFHCLSTGDYPGVVSIGLAGYDAISIPFTKSCEKSEPTAKLNVNFLGSTNTPIIPFSNSEFAFENNKALSIFVVVNGVVQSGWQPGSSNLYQACIQSDLQLHQFTLNYNNSLVGKPTIKAYDDGVSVVSVGNIGITPNGGYFTLSYAGCQGTQSRSAVSVDIDVAQYDPVNFAFMALCPFDAQCASPSSASSSGGWSDAGIAFFALFWIALFCYGVGIGYKYIVLNARGWDMLPFIDFYRFVWGKCFGDQTAYKSASFERFDQPVHLSTNAPAALSNSRQDAPFSSYQTL